MILLVKWVYLAKYGHSGMGYGISDIERGR